MLLRNNISVFRIRYDKSVNEFVRVRVHDSKTKSKQEKKPSDVRSIHERRSFRTLLL